MSLAEIAKAAEVAKAQELAKHTKKPSRVLLALRICVALLGVAMAVAVPARLGFSSVFASLRPALPVLPYCVLCELLRVVCEAIATRLALGRKVPWGPMALAHLGAYAVVTVFPAPRVAAEALKTSVLGDHVGVPEAASAGATIQAATFFSVATLCLCAAFTSRGTTLSLVLLGNATLLIILGVALRGVMRSTRAVTFLSEKWPKHAKTIVRLAAVAKTGHLLAIGPSAFLLLSLFVRVGEQVLITRAMGGAPTLSAGFSLEGVRLLGASFGVLVPGQVGVREAIFALSAPSLGTTAAYATAVSLFTHAVELSLAFVGFAALLIFRAKPKATIGTAG